MTRSQLVTRHVHIVNVMSCPFILMTTDNCKTHLIFQLFKLATFHPYFLLHNYMHLKN